MVRTQIYLDEAVHQRLLRIARQQGRTLSDLVREALARAYGEKGSDELERTLRGIAGLWSDRSDLGKTRAYVRRLRSDTRRRRRTRR